MNTSINYAKAFDAFIKKDGGVGRFDTEYIDPERQLLFDKLKEYLQSFIDFARQSEFTAPKGKMPYVYFDFIDDLSFNAKAGFDEDGNEFIGLNHGAVLLIFDIFNRLLAHKAILPNIGFIDLEVNPVKLPALTRTYADIQAFFDHYDLTTLVRPKQKIRIDHARLLSEFALIFLVEHEMAHLLYGHVHYKKQKSGFSFIMEFDEDQAEQVFPPFTNKCLEWSADSWSAAQAINRLIQLVEKSDTFDHLNSVYNPPESGVYINWAFSMWVIFRLMDVVRTAKGQEKSLKYPVPMERFISVFDMAWQVLDHHGTKYKHEILTNSVIDHLCEAEKGLHLISVNMLNKKEFGDFVDGLYVDDFEDAFITKIRSHWKSVVKPELLPLTRTTDIM